MKKENIYLKFYGHIIENSFDKANGTVKLQFDESEGSIEFRHLQSFDGDDGVHVFGNYPYIEGRIFEKNPLFESLF